MRGPTDRPKKRRSGIQVDLYGIKVDGLRPGQVDEDDPKSWQDVRALVKSSLMKLCVGVPALLVDIVTGSRRLVRGIAEFPAAVNRRVSKSHDLAEAGEGKRQENAVALRLPPPDKTDALKNLQAFVEQLALGGVPFHVDQLEDGTTFLSLLSPERQEDGAQLALAALPPPGPSHAPLGEMPVELFLPPRIAQALVTANTYTAGVLASRTRAELMAVQGIGEKSLMRIVVALDRLGLPHDLGSVPSARQTKAESS